MINLCVSAQQIQRLQWLIYVVGAAFAMVRLQLLLVDLMTPRQADECSRSVLINLPPVGLWMSVVLTGH